MIHRGLAADVAPGFRGKKRKKETTTLPCLQFIDFSVESFNFGGNRCFAWQFLKRLTRPYAFFIADVVAIDLRRKKICELNNFCSLKSIIRIISTSSKFKTVKLNAASESGLHCMFKIKRRTFAHHKRYL